MKIRGLFALILSFILITSMLPQSFVYAEEKKEDLDVEIKIKDLKSKGFKDKEISVILSTLFGLSKNDVYKKSLNCKNL